MSRPDVLTPVFMTSHVPKEPVHDVTHESASLRETTGAMCTQGTEVEFNSKAMGSVPFDVNPQNNLVINNLLRMTNTIQLRNMIESCCSNIFLNYWRIIGYLHCSRGIRTVLDYPLAPR
jgi:hypothetical protein